MKRILIMTLALLCCTTLHGRERYIIDDDWKFFFRSENDSDNARSVNLPHTWAFDPMNPTGETWHTTGNYVREVFIPWEWKGRRVFVKFYGVQNVADLLVNGRHAGEHRGGTTAFVFEITDRVVFGETNTLHVIVNNAYQNDVLPTSTDQNVYGGIYRDVELVVTAPVAVSPMFYGSDGVMVRQTSVTRDKVEAAADIYLTAQRENTPCTVDVRVTAPDDYVVAHKSVRAKVESGKPVSVPFTVMQPSLWSPQRPDMYKVEVSVSTENSTDTVCVSTGFRDIEVTNDAVAFNSRETRLHGVNLYHDTASAANALTAADYDAMLADLTDMGAGALRSMSGPHAQYLYDECDRRGIAVWIDMPFVRSPFLSDIPYYASERFADNCRQQMYEIIYQNYNHPSVVMWGLFSLLQPRDGNVEEQIAALNEAVRKADPSRPTVACSNADGAMNRITDLIVWQQNIGWIRGATSDLRLWCDFLYDKWRTLRSGVCYGADEKEKAPASKTVRDASASYWRGMQRARAFHEDYAATLAEGCHFWGVWINSLYDYGSSRREGGICATGVVAYDHKTKKDSYYLYRALWNSRDITVHIVERDRRRRDEEQPRITVIASTDVPVVTLDGEPVAMTETAPCRYESEPVARRGTFTVRAEVEGRSDEVRLTFGSPLKPVSH